MRARLTPAAGVRAVGGSLRRFGAAAGDHEGANLRALVDADLDRALFLLDVEGRVTTWSAGAELQTGCAAEHVVGRPFSALFADPAGGPPPQLALDAARVQGRHELSAILQRRSAPPFAARVTVTALHDADAELTGYAVVARPRPAEGALALHQALFEHISEAVCIFREPGGEILQMNARCAEAFGVARDAMLGRPLALLVQPGRDVGPLQATVEAAIAERGAYVAERARARPDGSIVWLRGSIAPLRGAPEGVRALVLTDVTAERQAEDARRRAQEELEVAVAARTAELSRANADLRAEIDKRAQAERDLRLSEARFTGLAASGILGVFVGDPAGAVSEANDTLLDMLGWTREDVAAGRLTPAAMVPPDQAEAAARIGAELAARRVVRQVERELLHKSGARVPVLFGEAMLDDRHTIGYVLDLAEQKRAQQSLRRAEDQLRQAQKMEAVGRLAGGVAHDFNNLLSVVLSYSELVAQELGEADPLRADLDEINKAARRAAELTRQLLLFSRHQVAATRVLDLGEGLRGMERMLRRILGEDIDFATVVADRLGRVKADPSHMEQVLMNLVVNARDAMPRGGKLTVEVANVTVDGAFVAHHGDVQPGPYVMIAVTDTGTGMDEATLGRIFEPFFTTKEQGKGTGLGLATVFGIVQQSGGHVWVYSEVGHGTTFKIYLPRVDAALPSVRPEARPTTLEGDELVLLVEDEAQVRAVAASILRHHGYRVLEAANAGEALLLCEKHGDAIALLLTDVVMPGMSGPELAKRLAKLIPNARVLCMSGYTDDSIVRHGVLESELAFLQKPLTPRSLARRVRQVLDEE